MDLNLEIKRNIFILEKSNFNITYSRKDRVLIIQQDNIFISGIKDMLTISTLNDSETFFISPSLLKKFKIKLNKNNIDFIISCGNYVPLKISNLPFTSDVLKNIRYAIFNLISFYINDNFSYNQKYSKIISL